MKTYSLKTPITETAEQAVETESQKGKIAKQILLGIDAHQNSYQVGRKIDAGGIQPAQSFKEDKLLGFVAKQQRLAEKVYAVYEAGLWATCSTASSRQWELKRWYALRNAWKKAPSVSITKSMPRN